MQSVHSQEASAKIAQKRKEAAAAAANAQFWTQGEGTSGKYPRQNGIVMHRDIRLLQESYIMTYLIPAEVIHGDT